MTHKRMKAKEINLSISATGKDSAFIVSYALTKSLNATKPLKRIPSPDSVVAYHEGLSSLRPGFKSRSGRYDFFHGIFLPEFCIFVPYLNLSQKK